VGGGWGGGGPAPGLVSLLACQADHGGRSQIPESEQHATACLGM
jgi:hypothetical protein